MDRLREKTIRENYHKLTVELIRRKLTITTMESATSGQIASLITDTEGSSAILKGAFITYSNEVKIKMGVPADVIDRYTVYSEETAAAMAEACRNAFAADIGIGITGTFGNIDPANPDASEPGEIYFAVSTLYETKTRHISLPACDSRLEYKLAAADAVCESVMKCITFMPYSGGENNG